MNAETAESTRYSAPPSGDTPGKAVEPWFAILLSSLVPLLVGLFVPDVWRTALHVLGGALCALGLVLLVRHEIAVRGQRNVTGHNRNVTDR
jgi:hypothetical protein